MKEKLETKSTAHLVCISSEECFTTLTAAAAETTGALGFSIYYNEFN